MDADRELTTDISQFYDDPLGYIMFIFPWRTDPSIQMVPLVEPYKTRFRSEFGPDKWACEFLDQLGEEIRDRKFNGHNTVLPIRFSTASGHGIGKSAMVSWLILFILDTRPRAMGVVTANTGDQLRTKTWAEMAKWHHLALSSHFWEYTNSRGNMSLSRKGSKDIKQKWRCDALTSRAENAESFQGLHAANSTPFYIFDEACFREGTEVLTKEGWKLFQHLSPSDLLITPKGWQSPIALHSSWREGNMLEVKKRGLSFSITPNHEVYITTQNGVSKKVRADKLSTSGGIAPRVVKWSNKDYDVRDDQIILDAWYFSEGHLIPGGYGFGITNNEDQGISALLDRLGLRWKKHNNQWLVYERKLASNYLKCGKGCLNKTFPSYFFQFSQRQMKLFLLTYLKGDGYWKSPNRGIIYTSSKRMADDLHALAVLAGYNSSHTIRHIKGQRKWIGDHWVVSSVDGHVISLSSSGEGVKLTKNTFFRHPYKGMVYCATVPAGMLLTRREGTVVWSGNSGIEDKIWEARFGGATDGESMSFDFGNPTRKSGYFYENCVGKSRHRYIVRQIDSREVYITSKPYIEELREDWGEESDLFKVKIRGVFPFIASVQFISDDLVLGAMLRSQVADKNDPLLIGVDVARFGDNYTVIFPRMGMDAKSWQYRKYNRLDNVQVAEKVIEMVHSFRMQGKNVSGLFIDGGGLGAGPVDILRRLGYNPIDVNFGKTAIDRRYRRWGDQMWGNMRDSLLRLSLPNSLDLKTQLTQREYNVDDNGQITLESKKIMKERGVPSPDIADALALTFAQEISVDSMRNLFFRKPMMAQSEYDPFESDW